MKREILKHRAQLSFFSPLTDGEIIWIYFITQSLVWLAASVFIARSTLKLDGNALKYLLYIIAFLALPIANYCAIAWIRRCDVERKLNSVVIVLTSNALIVPIALLLLAYAPRSVPSIAIILIVLTLVATIANILIVRIDNLFSPSDLALCLRTSAIICGIELILLPIVAAPGSWTTVLSLAHTGWLPLGLFLGLSCAILMIFSCQMPVVAHWQRRPFVAGTFVSAAILLILLCSMQPNLLDNEWHMNYFLGPARAVMAGGVPYVNVQSEYGASYLIFLIGVPFGILPTYSSIVLITGLANAITFGIYLAILIKETKQPVVSAIAMTATALFVTTWVPYFGGIPSTGGVRFLPITALLLLFQLNKDSVRGARILFLLVLIWCLLWSAESFVFSVLLLSAQRLTRTSPAGIRWTKALLDLIMFGSICVLILGVAYFILLIWSGERPRINDYLEILSSHIGLDATVPWYLPLDPNFYYWLPIGLMLSVLLCSAFITIFPTHRDHRLVETLQQLRPTILICVLAVLELTYWLGRSHWTNFVVSIVPAVATSIVVAYIALSRSSSAARTVTAIVVSVYFMLAAGCVTAAVLTFSPSPTQEGLSLRIPATLQIASGEGASIWENVARWPLLTDGAAKDLDNLQRQVFTAQPRLSYQEFAEIRSAVDAYAPQHSGLLLFVGGGHTTDVLMFLNRIHALPIACLTCDGLSASQGRYIATHVDLLREGSPIFLHNNLATVIDGKIKTTGHLLAGDASEYVFNRINLLWELTPVQQGSYVGVYRLRSRSPSL